MSPEAQEIKEFYSEALEICNELKLKKDPNIINTMVVLMMDQKTGPVIEFKNAEPGSISLG